MCEKKKYAQTLDFKKEEEMKNERSKEKRNENPLRQMVDYSIIYIS